MSKFNIMKLFRRKKSSKNLNRGKRIPRLESPSQQFGALQTLKTDFTAKLTPALLERIFTFVCPHAQDETYETCEQSTVGDSCGLCDLRDLAHCAQVSRRWRECGTNVLYHSIRIDAVHYCPREDTLAERRKRKSFLVRNAEPEDVPAARLRLLCRTLREHKSTYAPLVGFLKTPYMTRGACKSELAQTVAVLANIRYVDLPDGLFMDDASCSVLKQSLQAGCLEIRKMTYMAGSERSLGMLSSGTIWTKLEVLELVGLNMDPAILRRVLGALPNLHALKISDMRSFNDDLFRPSNQLPPFPPFHELIFEDVPNLTAEGLAGYLFRSDTQEALKTLALTATGVHPSTLQHILAVAPRLEDLSITEAVTSSFPSDDSVQPLQSKSLRIFHYEITSGSSANSFASTTASYYAYLTSSLLAGGLPNLEELYVRDSDFPDTLIDLRPPAPAYASDPDSFRPPTNPFAQTSSTSKRFSSNNPFAKLANGNGAPFTNGNGPLPGLHQPLQVYAKGSDDETWNFYKVAPTQNRGRRGSGSGRPLSSYGLKESMGPAWARSPDTKRATMMGNGCGGFLAVPGEGAGNLGVRPSSSASEMRRGSLTKEYDMWR